MNGIGLAAAVAATLSAEKPTPVYRAVADLATGLVWQMTSDDADMEEWGIVMSWFHVHDEADAMTQANNGYMRTAGVPFSPFVGFELLLQPNGEYLMQYRSSNPDDEEQDPPYEEQVRCQIRDEIVLGFPHGWICIVKADKSYVVARCD